MSRGKRKLFTRSILKEMSNEDLDKTIASLLKKANRSHGAIEKDKDWMTKTTSQHQLYKSLVKDNELRYEPKQRRTKIKTIMSLQKATTGKGATLTGSREMARHRVDAFVESAKRAYEDAGTPKREQLTNKQLRATAKDENFYKFLSSDSFRKIQESAGGIGSDKAVEQYMKYGDSALSYYDSYLSKLEETGGAIDYTKLTVK